MEILMTPNLQLSEVDKGEGREPEKRLVLPVFRSVDHIPLGHLLTFAGTQHTLKYIIEISFLEHNLLVFNRIENCIVHLPPNVLTLASLSLDDIMRFYMLGFCMDPFPEILVHLLFELSAVRIMLFPQFCRDQDKSNLAKIFTAQSY